MTGACIDRRDQLIVENAVYLFVVGLPRQANRWKCRLSIRGGFAVTSKSPEMSFIYSRWACRDKQIAGKVVYLFAVGSPCQAKHRKSRVSIRGELAVPSNSGDRKSTRLNSSHVSHSYAVF